MRFDRLFTRTQRETPAGLDLEGQQFLARAGYFQALIGGRAALLPLGKLALDRLTSQIAAALQELGGMEVSFAGDGLSGLSEICRAHLRSHRQLPALLYRRAQWEDAVPRRGNGLLSARSREVLEVFHLNSASDEVENLSEDLSMALLGPLAAMGVPLQGGLGDCGPGGETAHNWLWAHPAGDDSLLYCADCGYAAAPAAAAFGRAPAVSEAVLPVEKVATPECKTIAELARFLQISESRTAKAVFLTALFNNPDQPPREELIFAVVRGDRDVNEAALRRLTGCDRLQPASEDSIRACGAVPGYASPVGLKNVRVIVDSEIPASPNLVSGANEAGYHLLNVNFGRDYSADLIADIALAQPGMPCPECSASLSDQAGFNLISSRRMSADFALAHELNYLDENSRPLPLRVEIHRLDLSRLLGCLAELNHDTFGLRLPDGAAPYPVHLVILPGKDGFALAAGLSLEATLQAAGLETLTDERAESPGVKFNDADLIGLPLRITVGERSLKQGGVELRRRGEAQGRIVPLDEIVAAVQAELRA